MPQSAPDRLAELEKEAFLAQAENLAILRGMSQWDSWIELLRKYRAGCLEELANVANPEEFRYYQGAAFAINEIMERPDNIINEAANLRDEEESKRKTIRTEIRALTRAIGDDL